MRSCFTEGECGEERARRQQQHRLRLITHTNTTGLAEAERFGRHCLALQEGVIGLAGWFGRGCLVGGLVVFCLCGGLWMVRGRTKGVETGLALPRSVGTSNTYAWVAAAIMCVPTSSISCLRPRNTPPDQKSKSTFWKFEEIWGAF